MSIKGVVFDLDGTLLDTARLSSSRRAPWLVLEDAEPWGWRSDFDFTYGLPLGLQQIIGELQLAGLPVAIITRSPLAYASTALQSSGFTYEALLASQSAGSQSERLYKAIQMLGLLVEEVLYIGDTVEDLEAANSVGTQFAEPFWAYSPSMVSQFFTELAALSPSLRYLIAAWKSQTQNALPIPTDFNQTRLFCFEFRNRVGYSLFDSVVEMQDFKTRQLTRLLEHRETFIDLLIWPLHGVLGDEFQFLLSEPANTWDVVARGSELLRWIDDLGGLYDFYNEDEEKHLDSRLRETSSRYRGNHSPDSLFEYARALEIDQRGLEGVNTPVAWQETVDPIVNIFGLRQLSGAIIPYFQTMTVEDQKWARDIGGWLAELLDGNLLDRWPDGKLPGIFMSSNYSWYRFRDDWNYRFKFLQWLGAYVNQFEDHNLLFALDSQSEYPGVFKAGFDDLISAVHYWDKAGQNLWKCVKGWNGSKSGPEVTLGPLDAVAVVLASKILDWCKQNRVDPASTVVVPVPASPRTIAQPGEVSQRLAAAVSWMACLQHLDLFNKQGEIRYGARMPTSPISAIFMIDDQVTEGNSLIRSLSHIQALDLAEMESSKFVAVTWTHSRPRRSSAEQEIAKSMSAAEQLTSLRCRLADISAASGTGVVSTRENSAVPWLSAGNAFLPGWSVEPTTRLAHSTWFKQGEALIACSGCQSATSTIFRRHYLPNLSDTQEPNAQHYIAIVCLTCLTVRTPTQGNQIDYAKVKSLPVSVEQLCVDCKFDDIDLR